VYTYLSAEFEVITIAILIAEVSHSGHRSHATDTTITEATISIACPTRVGAGQGPKAMQLGSRVTVGVVVTRAAVHGSLRVVACFPSTAGGERQG